MTGLDGGAKGLWRGWHVGAGLGVGAAILGAVVLLAEGAEWITVYKNSEWMPLYWVPCALAFVNAVVAVLRSAVHYSRGRVGAGALMGLGVLSGVVAVALFFAGGFAWLMVSIGVEDGGWARR
ncbi:hypothetical protein [Spirillospora sp. NPDC047279]|uniref:hypothetical protein n=1 Tax=Spirillospora sp. NPDC047279 TaxID=3155478 RepID=UPI0033FBE801